MKPTLIKYPRTKHIEGSNLQKGDSDLSQVSLSSLTGVRLLIEEKMDGANCAMSFNQDGQIQFQSRGHYLTGGAREKHFDMFKAYGIQIQDCLHDILGQNYIMFGEWLYAKHTIFYDKLPNYFMEFDIYDRINGVFLDTERRHKLIEGVEGVVNSVKVLYDGEVDSKKELEALVTKSHFCSDNEEAYTSNFREECVKSKSNLDKELIQTDLTMKMEGLYIKVEEEGIVKERLKWVRYGFLQNVIESNSHWLARPIVRNRVV